MIYRAILIGMITLLGSGVLLAQEPDPFPEETRMLLEQYKTLQASTAKQAERVKKLEAERSRLTEEIEALRQELARSSAREENLEAQLTRRPSTGEKQPLTEDLEKAQEALATETRERAALEAQMQGLENRLKEAEESRLQSEARLRQLEASLRTEQTKTSEAAGKITGLEMALAREKRAAQAKATGSQRTQELEVRLQQGKIELLTREKKMLEDSLASSEEANRRLRERLAALEAERVATTREDRSPRPPPRTDGKTADQEQPRLKAVIEEMQGLQKKMRDSIEKE